MPSMPPSRPRGKRLAVLRPSPRVQPVRATVQRDTNDDLLDILFFLRELPPESLRAAGRMLGSVVPANRMEFA